MGTHRLSLLDIPPEGLRLGGGKCPSTWHFVTQSYTKFRHGGRKTYINVPKCSSYTLLTIALSAKISSYEHYGKNKNFVPYHVFLVVNNVVPFYENTGFFALIICSFFCVVSSRNGLP